MSTGQDRPEETAEFGVVISPTRGTYEPNDIPNSIKSWRENGEQIIYLGERDGRTYWLSIYDPTQNRSVSLRERDGLGFVYSFSDRGDLDLCAPFDLYVEFYQK